MRFVWVIIGLLMLSSSLVHSAPATPGGLCINNTNCPSSNNSDATIVAPRSINVNNFHPGYYYSVGHSKGTSEEVFGRLIDLPEFVGGKRIYTWRVLESQKGVYDFSKIEADLAYLESIGKRLWIYVGNTQFNGNGPPNMPQYMWDDATYGCGYEYEYYGSYRRETQAGGWLPCFWNDEVKARFIALATALGERFNSEPYFEGISFDETAIDTYAAKKQAGYSANKIKETYQARVLAARNAFPDKIVMQKINFAPYDIEEFGAWLVENDIGIGSPDIYLENASLTTKVYPQYLKYHHQVPTGPDIQWKNYEKATAEELLLGAIEVTNPWYIFWLRRDAYFDDVLEAIRMHGELPAAAAFYDLIQE